MSQSRDDYHLGTSDEELKRLGFQHRVWQEETERLKLLAGFGSGQILLDLGSGPGFVSREFARLVGRGGHVHAVEAASRFVYHHRASLDAEGSENVTVHHADVHEIPLEDATVDGAFARWLLCFVSDPQQVCKEVARVMRPGGVFVAWDYFNYHSVRIFPEHEAIRKLFKAFHESALVNGGSYDIGQALPQMLINSGFDVEHLVPINRVARPGSDTWSWVTQFTAGYLPKLVEAGLMNAEEANEVKIAWKMAEADPATFFFPPPMLGIVARKQAA